MVVVDRFKEFLRWLGPFQIYTLVVLFVLFLYAKFVGVIGFNTDISLSYKVFYVDKTDKGPFDVGDIVVFKFWGSDYYNEGHKMVKKVVCPPGSYLKVVDRYYYCNNVFIGKAKSKDRYGKFVYNYYYDGIIPSGYYFVMGTHPDSYDSRYYGLVWQGFIEGRAYPLF